MAKKKKAKPEKAEKTRITTYLPVELIEKVRDAVYWSPGYTVAKFAEEAFAAHLQKMEMARGGPFEARTGKLKAGRPLG